MQYLILYSVLVGWLAGCGRQVHSSKVLVLLLWSTNMAGLALGLGGDIGMGLLAGGSRPSYFEMFAQEFIVTSLRPAIQFASAVLAPTFPILFRTQRWHDEIFTVLLGLLEWAHLRTQNATFAENFFALKRLRYFPPSASAGGKVPPSSWLRPRDQLGSRFCMVLTPY